MVTQALAKAIMMAAASWTIREIHGQSSWYVVIAAVVRVHSGLVFCR